MEKDIQSEQEVAEMLCNQMSGAVSSQEDWVEALQSALDEVDAQAVEEKRLRKLRLDVKRERTALATSITAALEAWIEDVEREVAALATPAARASSLHHSWQSAPALGFLQRETVTAFDESCRRLRKREARLTALLTSEWQEPSVEEVGSPSAINAQVGRPPAASMPEEEWEAKKLADLRETAEAQAKLRPLLIAVVEAQESLISMEREAANLFEAIGTAQQVLSARLERWDSDAFSSQWAAAAQKLHAKDRSTALLLERRRVLREKATTELHEHVPATLSTLPKYISEVELSQQRCRAFRASLLPASLLMQEEVTAADHIAIVCAERSRIAKRDLADVRLSTLLIDHGR